jgi:hypothetical protein
MSFVGFPKEYVGKEINLLLQASLIKYMVAESMHMIVKGNGLVGVSLFGHTN